MSRSAAHRPWQGSATIFAAELLILPTGLVTAGYLTRHLGPDGYGLLTLSVSAIGWLQWASSSMLSRASNRAIAAVGDWRPVAAEVVRLHLLLGTTLGVVVLIAASVFSAALGQPSLTTTIRLLAIDSTIMVLAQGYRGALIANGDHRWVSIISAARWIVRMVAVVGMVALGWSVNGAVGGIMVSSAVVLSMSRLRVGALHRATSQERRAMRAGLLVLAAPIALAGIGARLFERADFFLLAALGGSTTSLGHYGAAQNLTVVLSLLAGAVSPVVLTTVTRMRLLAQHDEMRQLQQDVLRLPYLVLPFAALAAGAAPDLMRVIYGAKFLEAATPFAFLMFGSAALVAVSLSTVLLVAVDRAWAVVGLTGPMLLALLVLTLLLVPRYGASGPAIASLVVSAVAAGVGQVLVGRYEAVHVSLRTMTVSVGLAALAFAAGSAWPSATTLGTVVKLLTVCIALLSALLLLRELPAHLLPFVAARSSSTKSESPLS